MAQDLRFTAMFVVPQDWKIIKRLASRQDISAAAFVRNLMSQAVAAARQDGRLPAVKVKGK